MKTSSLVLLSAGLDSSYNLYRAFQETKVLLALSFDYGQRAAVREIQSAASLAKSLGVPHQVVELPWFKDFTNTALINREHKLPTDKNVEIDSFETSLVSAKAVWVPNRNGIFLNIAAGFAEGLGAEFVIPGFNREEATTFPDNSYDYMKALDHSFHFSTQGRVRVKCYSHELDKTEIVKDGIKLKLPFEKLWPCYEANKSWCGECESCKRYARALEANGISFSKLNSRR